MAWEEHRSAPSPRAGLAAAVALAFVLLFPAQVLFVLGAAEVGLPVPSLLLAVLLPALLVSLVPAEVARRLYSARLARWTLAGTFLGTALAARLLRDVYRLCGTPGC